MPSFGPNPTDSRVFGTHERGEVTLAWMSSPAWVIAFLAWKPEGIPCGLQHHRMIS